MTLQTAYNTILWIVIYLITHLSILLSSCDFRFGSMALLTGTRPRITVSAGFNMALEDYNTFDIYNMEFFTSNILSLNNNTCSITKNMKDMQSDIKIGIVEAFELAQEFGAYEDNGDYINIPIVIGPPTSGYSLTLNPLTAAFDLLQFSSTATSTFLSEYQTFYRSIPSDDLQANALVKLCVYFGWKNIGILYMNTNYGSSLQQAITSYAKSSNISSTTFSYIDGDNITISDAVESMKASNIYINILISYGSDLEYITTQIIKYNMVGYPYYFIGTDSWLGTIGEDAQILDIYGGVIGTCPWSPSLNDSFALKYPYPINISIQMYKEFNDRWSMYYNDNRFDLLYNYSEPGFFTGYAYDNILTVIKSIDEYVQRYMTNGYDINFWNNSNITARFAEILHEIWFVGLTGNVTYDHNGDRANGLFSFCNVDPLDGASHIIGYVIDNENNNLEIDIDESLIKWPHDYESNPPQYEYIAYMSLPSSLRVGVLIFCILAIIFTLILMCYLFCYRTKKIIKASQWRLSLVMCYGVILTYITIIIFGIDEYYNNINWLMYCNIRIIFINASFGLTFGPLFAKVYRIKTIFNVGSKLKKISLTDTKMAFYNLIYVGIDFLVCFILICSIPYDRIYRESATYNIEREFWGSCSTKYFYVYLLLLCIPKIILICYCVILSISVYSTVSMMKYNEGLQILITIFMSVILLIIAVIILSIMTVDSSSSAIFFYGFLSLILLMVCNFSIMMMILPRLIAIWKNEEDEYVKENLNVEAKAKKYLTRIKSFKVKRKKDKQQSNQDSGKTDSNNNGVDQSIDFEETEMQSTIDGTFKSTHSTIDKTE